MLFSVLTIVRFLVASHSYALIHAALFLFGISFFCWCICFVCYVFLFSPISHAICFFFFGFQLCIEHTPQNKKRQVKRICESFKIRMGKKWLNQTKQLPFAINVESELLLRRKFRRDAGIRSFPICQPLIHHTRWTLHWGCVWGNLRLCSIWDVLRFWFDSRSKFSLSMNGVYPNIIPAAYELDLLQSY